MQIASLRRLGAPVGLHLLSDLPQAPEYKVYLFLNATDLTPDQRRAIERLKRDGKLLVFVQAAGLGRVGDRGVVAEDAEGMRELTGLDTQLDRTAGPLRAELVKGEPLGRNPVLRAEYGGSRGGFGPAGDFAPRCLPPGNGVTVLARYPDGRPALVTRHMRDWAVAYSAVPGIPPGVLHNLARQAGVHLFTAAGDALYAGHGCVALHARTTGRKVIRLPGRYEVREMFGQQRRWSDVGRVELRLTAKETSVLTVSQP